MKQNAYGNAGNAACSHYGNNGTLLQTHRERMLR